MTSVVKRFLLGGALGVLQLAGTSLIGLGAILVSKVSGGVPAAAHPIAIVAGTLLFSYPGVMIAIRLLTGRWATHIGLALLSASGLWIGLLAAYYLPTPRLLERALGDDVVDGMMICFASCMGGVFASLLIRAERTPGDQGGGIISPV